jgi:O-antigen biosynthesis protein WbqP
MLRFLDITLSAIGLAVSAPLLLIVGIAIPLFSSGPALFRQERVGRHKSSFICLKFRTMHVGTANVASHHVGADAITGIGRFLRKTKLDELPQLWNVLCGDMSLVGPRPCLPVQVELVVAREKRGLYTVRPGITGPAQVKGIDMSAPETLAIADMVWLSEQRFGAYFKYIVQTVLGAGQGDAVSPN